MAPAAVILGSISLILLLQPVFTQSQLPRKLGSFKTTHPGFLTLARNTSAHNSLSSWNLIISRFNGIPFSKDYVSVVNGVGQFVKQPGSIEVIDVSDYSTWPNEAKEIPDCVFNRPNMVIVPSGFLVPTKNKGKLTILDLNEAKPSPHEITSSSDEKWFYHRVIWMDMNGDGLMDAVTCRAYKPIFGNAQGELIWLKQPSSKAPWNTVWESTVLFEGPGAPDTFLIAANLTQGKSLVQTIITAGFFSQSLDIWWRKDEKQPWTASNIQKRVIDNTQGPAFDVTVADVNMDGKKDLLVTYNKGKAGTMIAYEMPLDFSTGNFTKHVIMSGMNPAKSGIGKGAPGAARVVHTTNKLTPIEVRPSILLSGDDNGIMYIYTASSPGNRNNWNYTAHVIENDQPGTVGQMAVEDVDGDGWLEVFVPAYDDGTISLYTFRPSGL